MKRNIRKKKNKKIIVLVIITILIALFAIAGFKVYKDNQSIIVGKKVVNLSNNVVTTNEIPMYRMTDGKYEKIGSISKDTILNIDNVNEDGYYLLTDFEKEYYVKSDNLEDNKESISVDDRYKKYIVFNLNANTTDVTKLYDEDGNLIYSINESYSLPIYIKESERYGVEFNNQLMYIKSEDCSVVENHNTDKENVNGVGVFNYHFFYDETDSQQVSDCNQEICVSKSQFTTHLNYIKDNDILTLKMKEVEMYIDGEIRLPRSVLITIDDGWQTKVAVDLLTEYKMYATIFLVTSWFDVDEYYRTDYIELHSHSDDMHDAGVCDTGQGGGIQCLDEETIQNDLKLTREKLNNTTYFCYPFYEYNEYSIKMLKEAGFTMAFVGESSRSDNLVKVGSDKFRLPRFVVVDYTTMDTFSSYLEQMK